MSLKIKWRLGVILKAYELMLNFSVIASITNNRVKVVIFFIGYWLEIEV